MGIGDLVKIAGKPGGENKNYGASRFCTARPRDILKCSNKRNRQEEALTLVLVPGCLTIRTGNHLSNHLVQFLGVLGTCGVDRLADTPDLARISHHRAFEFRAYIGRRWLIHRPSYKKFGRK